MPRLERSQWYDLSRDMNWAFKYVTEAEVFPEALSRSHEIPPAAWWSWDEPYKISYREYAALCQNRRSKMLTHTARRTLGAAVSASNSGDLAIHLAWP